MGWKFVAICENNYSCYAKDFFCIIVGDNFLLARYSND